MKRPAVAFSLVLAIFAATGGAAAVPAQSGARSPGRIAGAAERAVEDDSADVVRARLRSALGRDPADREAMLGLATLARATYDFDTADSLFARLLAAGPAAPDAWTVQARLGLYRMANARGDNLRADSLLRIAMADARRIRDRDAEIYALIGFSTTRVGSIGALYATMDTIARLLPPGDSRDRAEYNCRLGVYRGISGESNSLDLLRRGMAMAERTGERQLLAHCLEGYGLINSIQGRNDSALVIYDRAAVLLRATHEHAGLSRQ